MATANDPGEAGAACHKETIVVLQCPRCEIRFLSKSEFDDHRALDHPAEKAPAEDERLGGDPDRDRVRGSTAGGPW